MSIYGIRNLVTGRTYVGATGCLGDRWNVHRYLLNKGNHPNADLQSDWNNLGGNEFEWIVFEELFTSHDGPGCTAEVIWESPHRERCWVDQVLASGDDLYNKDRKIVAAHRYDPNGVPSILIVTRYGPQRTTARGPQKEARGE